MNCISGKSEVCHGQEQTKNSEGQREAEKDQKGSTKEVETKKSAEKAMKKLAEEKKRNEDKERRKFKEINPSLVVRTTNFLGAGTFGSCYLAFYRDMVVAVKEFKERKNIDLAHLRSEVRHEATIYYTVTSPLTAHITYVKLLCLILPTTG